jgi:hypothetical protein
MAAGQQWLFAPARPLVERLGKKFFRKVPARPGVYFMRGESGDVVYVGKAKNLRQRLQSYRVANPDRMPRRHLRMVREVARIDFDFCPNEAAALAREAKLLRDLKPRFNRAGVWPAKSQFLTWRFADQTAQFSVQEIPPLGWERYGSLGGYARPLLRSLVRLLWLAVNPQAGFSRLPHGWAQNRIPLPVEIACGPRAPEVRQALENLCWGPPEKFSAWVLSSTDPTPHPFERAAVQTDIEEIENFVASHRDGRPSTPQLELL